VGSLLLLFVQTVPVLNAAARQLLCHVTNCVILKHITIEDTVFVVACKLSRCK